ncbi:hypothetical protein ACOMHN_019881 [Nucella lapillus]
MAIPFGSLRPRHTTVLSRRDVGQTRRLATPASKRTRNDARALKATFVLIPLFGGQLFVTIYRLPAGVPGGVQYEQFTVFVNNSQVIAQMKRTCTRFNLLRPGGGEITSRATTLATSLHQRDEDSEYVGGHNGNLHNGSSRPSLQTARGRGGAAVAKKSSSNNGNYMENSRNYSYIPMKTLYPNS